MANNLLDYVGLGYFLEKIKTLFVTALGTSGNYLTWTKNGTTNNITVPYSSATASIPFGYTDSTSTASALTATVPGITELKDGVCCMIDNTVIAGSSSGFTLNVNNLGAKTVYSINSTMHSSPTIATTWNKPYRGFLVYLAAMNNNTGGWIIGYLTNTTYSAITAAAIETGTATTARTVTAAVLKAAYNIDTTTGTIKIGANSITPLTQHLDVSGKEDKTNKVTSLSSSSTDALYPSAKLVYDKLATKLNAPTIVLATCYYGDIISDLHEGELYGFSTTVNSSTILSKLYAGEDVYMHVEIYSASTTETIEFVYFKGFLNLYSNDGSVFYRLINYDFSRNLPQIKILKHNGTTITAYEKDMEVVLNKVTSISSSSTDTQYPSAKAVYSNINNKHSKDYLTFEVLESGTINFTPISGNENIILYSKDNGVTWTLGSSVSVNTGDRVMWKGSGFTPENSGTGGIGTFGDASSTSPVTTIKFKVYGNIMSLVYGDNFENQTEFAGAANFCCLFKETKVTEAHNLILPSTDLVERCYNKMFMDCAELISMPDLHGIVLAKHCYSKMFSGCTKLYYNIPEVLPITTLAINCYDGMFINCSSMVVAPKLPATILADSCYSAMFLGCSNLEVAPELPAATFTSTCCWRMFDGCSKLKFIKCLATDISASNSHPAWTTSVGANGVFVTADTPPAWPSGVNGIPTSWTSYTESLWKEVRHYELSSKEDTTNKVTSLSASSTDTQYPSAKCVYDAINNINPRIPITNHGTSDTTFTLTPNIYHKWGNVSSLTLTLATPDDSSRVNEYLFSFTSPSTPTTLSLPATVEWAIELDIEANKTYYISIVDNLATFLTVGMTVNDTTLTTYATKIYVDEIMSDLEDFAYRTDPNIDYNEF